MQVSEKIYEEVSKLPEPLQVEVLDFIQFLASKANRDIPATDDLSHAGVSLALAMRGMEDEAAPAYSIEDLRETFS
jgi:hypothetical protein